MQVSRGLAAGTDTRADVDRWRQKRKKKSWESGEIFKAG
jgi:hypothetical protein